MPANDTAATASAPNADAASGSIDDIVVGPATGGRQAPSEPKDESSVASSERAPRLRLRKRAARRDGEVDEETPVELATGTADTAATTDTAEGAVADDTVTRHAYVSEAFDHALVERVKSSRRFRLRRAAADTPVAGLETVELDAPVETAVATITASDVADDITTDAVRRPRRFAIRRFARSSRDRDQSVDEVASSGAGVADAHAAAMPFSSVADVVDADGPEAVANPAEAGFTSPEVRADSAAAGGDVRATGPAWLWLVVFALVGLTVSAVAGWRSGGALDRQAAQRFDQRANAVAAPIGTALQHNADVTSATRAFVTSQPQATNAQFAQFYDTVAASNPESTGVVYVRNVSHVSLFNFVLSLAHDPTSAFTSGAPFSITPAQTASSYCLTQLMAIRSSLVSAADLVLPSGLNLCGTATSKALQQAGDTGRPVESTLLAADEGAGLALSGGSGSISVAAGEQTMRSLDQAFGSTVVMFEPVYSAGPLSTVAQRRQALQGWVGGVFDAGAIVQGALGTTTDLQVSLSGADVGGVPQVVASRFTGTALGSTDTFAINAAGRWTVAVRQPRAGFFASGAWRGLEVGGTGLLATIALVVAMAALVRSRRRALALADAQSSVVEHVTLHDPVTGLPNRALVTDRAEQMLARSRRTQVPCAALAVGVDGFKDFVELHGHRRAELVLQMMADRLRSLLREADTVGRVADDEFAILIEGATLEAGPELVGERITEVIREPYHLEGDLDPFTLTACVGIALGPRVHGEDLLRDAGLALSESRSVGPGAYGVFGRDLPQAVESRLAFENELRSAVASQQFFLRYQPIFDIESRTTTGVEALLRWQHPTRRVVPPDHFLPMLEETGLIVPLGRWVLGEACRQGAALHRDGYRITMSVNISAVQLESDSMVADVADAIDASGFDPHALILEIAETTLTRNTELMVARLVALKELGVRIAIDDFGTGYSSLTYLRQFPIDILKIDRSFISSMASTRESSLIIRTLVQFSKTLGLQTIAEGVEEEGQIDPLLAEQCESGQGFLYGRPLSPTQLDIFLRTHLTQDPPLWVVAPKLGAR